MPLFKAPAAGKEDDLQALDEALGIVMYVPGYAAGVGGVDKVDCPGPEGEKRKISNMSDPHTEMRAREEQAAR